MFHTCYNFPEKVWIFFCFCFFVVPYCETLLGLNSDTSTNYQCFLCQSTLWPIELYDFSSEYYSIIRSYPVWHQKYISNMETGSPIKKKKNSDKVKEFYWYWKTFTGKYILWHVKTQNTGWVSENGKNIARTKKSVLRF